MICSCRRARAATCRGPSGEQHIAKRRDDVTDALLFPNAEAKQKAMPLSAWQRFQHGVCVVEAKRWNRSLDRADAGQKAEEGVPSTQILRYLRRVDDVTNGGLRWGILTTALAPVFSRRVVDCRGVPRNRPW